MEEDICFAVMLSLVSRDPFSKYGVAIVGCPVMHKKPLSIKVGGKYEIKKTGIA